MLIAGTSTDVSRFAGSYEHVFETTTAGVTIQAPQVGILIVHLQVAYETSRTRDQFELLFHATEKPVENPWSYLGE